MALTSSLTIKCDIYYLNHYKRFQVAVVGEMKCFFYQYLQDEHSQPTVG